MSDVCCCCCCDFVVVLLSPSPGCFRSCVCTLALVGLCYTTHLFFVSVSPFFFLSLFSVCVSIIFCVYLYLVCSCLPLLLLLLFLHPLLLSSGLLSLWYLQIVVMVRVVKTRGVPWILHSAWVQWAGVYSWTVLGRWCLVFSYFMDKFHDSCCGL